MKLFGCKIIMARLLILLTISLLHTSANAAVSIFNDLDLGTGKMTLPFVKVINDESNDRYLVTFTLIRNQKPYKFSIDSIQEADVNLGFGDNIYQEANYSSGSLEGFQEETLVVPKVRLLDANQRHIGDISLLLKINLDSLTADVVCLSLEGSSVNCNPDTWGTDEGTGSVFISAKVNDTVDGSSLNIKGKIEDEDSGKVIFDYTRVFFYVDGKFDSYLNIFNTPIEGSDIPFKLTEFSEMLHFEPRLEDGQHELSILVGSPETNSYMGNMISLLFTVDSDNQPPSAVQQDVNTIINKAVDITLDVSDPNNDPLSYQLEAAPEHGKLLGTFPYFSYIPDIDFTGGDAFAYSVSDGFHENVYSDVIISVSVDPSTSLILKEVRLAKSAYPGDQCQEAGLDAGKVCIQAERTASGNTMKDYWELGAAQDSATGKGSYLFEETNRVGLTVSDYKVEFKYEAPPSVITQGTTLELLSDGSSSGFTNGWYLPRSFTYYYKTSSGRNIYQRDEGEQVWLLNSNAPEQSGFRTSTIPVSGNLKPGSEFIIGGKLGWDPGLFIDWVYCVPDNDTCR